MLVHQSPNRCYARIALAIERADVTDLHQEFGQTLMTLIGDTVNDVMGSKDVPPLPHSELLQIILTALLMLAANTVLIEAHLSRDDFIEAARQCYDNALAQIRA
jgi:hypothetical protein